MKPKPAKCEYRSGPSYLYTMRVCCNKAKALFYFNDPAAAPMHVCGVHAKMFRKRGYRVEDLK